MEDYKKGLNKQQLEAVNTIYGPLLIIAGAGTGSTPCAQRTVPFPTQTGEA